MSLPYGGLIEQYLVVMARAITLVDDWQQEVVTRFFTDLAFRQRQHEIKLHYCAQLGQLVRNMQPGQLYYDYFMQIINTLAASEPLDDGSRDQQFVDQVQQIIDHDAYRLTN